jgi:hypothetical protein
MRRSEMKCEMCIELGSTDPGEAAAEVWMHEPFASLPSRHVPLCAECLRGVDEDDEGGGLT